MVTAGRFRHDCAIDLNSREVVRGTLMSGPHRGRTQRDANGIA
jgi:hypothetical protein